MQGAVRTLLRSRQPVSAFLIAFALSFHLLKRWLCCRSLNVSQAELKAIDSTSGDSIAKLLEFAKSATASSASSLLLDASASKFAPVFTRMLREVQKCATRLSERTDSTRI